MKLGLAGKLAKTFISSKLTPLFIIGSFIAGGFALWRTPREEEPQIVVPMADITLSAPGFTAKGVEQRVTTPIESLVSEIPGVEYVYSTSSSGASNIIVRFRVGEDQEQAMQRLRDKLQGRPDVIPAGVSAPVIRIRSIDDVAVLSLTFHSASADPAVLYSVAAAVEQQIKGIDNVSETQVIGGAKRQVDIMLDRDKLAQYGLTSDAVASAVQKANQSSTPGSYSESNNQIQVESGGFLTSAKEVGAVVVHASQEGPVTVSDVATVTDGAEEPKSYVSFGEGGQKTTSAAVTLSVAKKAGANAIDVVNNVLAKVNSLKGALVPSDVSVDVTRNYGATAADKSNDLLLHMGIAVLSVTVLVALVLGFKESLVVLTTIPVTLSLTLLMFYLYKFTLNRITLFALIFSIGILVDDAIVVLENIVRRMHDPNPNQLSEEDQTVESVDEVGNPTILATLAVIAAILPMAFVGGLMGPYMRPIPVGATAAMIFSLLVAFIVTPWAAIRLLRRHGAAVKAADHHKPDDKLTVLYRRLMTPMLRKPRARLMFFGATGLLLLAAISLVLLKAVTVKMLPFDNKNEFQVIVDMPTGTPLEQTESAIMALAARVAQDPNVHDYQTYVGTSSPFNFNGLVRHYYQRDQSYQGDIQVNLLDKSDRKAQSHDIAKALRAPLDAIAAQYGARIKMAEVPPGPPVLETLVAEVYGPTQAARLALAQKIKGVFQSTDGVADVDWYVDDNQKTVRYKVDRQKAALSDVSVSDINRTLAVALDGLNIGILHVDDSRTPVAIDLKFDRAQRSGADQLGQIQVASASGSPVPLSELTTATPAPYDASLYHKNLIPVVYVVGDVAGKQESPVYAILKMNQAIGQIQTAPGQGVRVLSTRQPQNTSIPTMKWDGEWQVTYEVFRDLGIAFAAVLALIYVLVVAWFRDFKTPLVIMAPIPLTLVGILPAHALMGAFFTATSMIGFIAGAGIIVRNSIILVDFIEQRRKMGYDLEQAVIDAGALRFRPMLLTAAAVFAGSFVILFDPIFQGLAISLMAGEIASTVLSRFAVPVLYFMSQRKGQATYGSI